MREPKREPRPIADESTEFIDPVSGTPLNEDRNHQSVHLDQLRRTDAARSEFAIQSLLHEIKEDTMSELSEEDIDAGVFDALRASHPTDRVVWQEVVKHGGEKRYIRYLAKESIAPYFGHESGKFIAVRADLPRRARRFVLAHELYHTTDAARWGGWVGRELRANFFPALRDPLGALSALAANLPELPSRIQFYINRFRRGN